MSKYHHEEEVIGKRIDKNKDTYRDIKNVDLDKLNLSNNVSVIKTDNRDLNIGEIKDILNKKYDEPKTKVFLDEPEIEETNLEITKEFKLKDAIDKAYSEKEDDYEKNRYKKLRNTEYEILKSIHVTEDEQPSVISNKEEGEILTSLLKTIDENALRRRKESDELLSDLMSDSDTNVLEPIKPDTKELDVTPVKPSLVEELERTKQLSRKDIDEGLEREEMTTDVVEKPVVEQSTTNTFYTGNLAIEDADLEDFKDLENEMNSNGILVKILIILLVLVVLVVAVYLLNKYLNLGLF